jgi:mono/diheme cytochrome c family protein
MNRFRALALSLLLSIILGADIACADDVAQGRGYFLAYCASCHGENADGRGPAAPSLKEQPPDLRRLSERYGTPLPATRLARYIDGRDMVSAHGSRAMPVWGRRFQEVWSAQQPNQANMENRIAQIVKYLDSIQLAGHPAAPPPATRGIAATRAP